MTTMREAELLADAGNIQGALEVVYTILQQDPQNISAWRFAIDFAPDETSAVQAEQELRAILNGKQANPPNTVPQIKKPKPIPRSPGMGWLMIFMMALYAGFFVNPLAPIAGLALNAILLYQALKQPRQEQKKLNIWILVITLICAVILGLLMLGLMLTGPQNR